jgi:hypothetical protein
MPSSFRPSDTANVNITTRRVSSAEQQAADAALSKLRAEGVVEVSDPVDSQFPRPLVADDGPMKSKVDLRVLNDYVAAKEVLHNDGSGGASSSGKAPKPPVSFAPNLAAVYKQSVPGVPGLIEASVTNGFMVVPVGDVSPLLTPQARVQLGLSPSSTHHVNTCTTHYDAFAASSGSEPSPAERKSASVCKLAQPEAKPAECMFVATPQGVLRLPRVVYADSASDCSIIKASVARSYGVKLYELKGRTVHMSTVGGVFSQPTVISEPVLLVFNKGGRELRVRVSMLVADVEALPYDIILGTPLLSALGAELDFKQQAMRIFPRWDKFGDASVSLNIPLSITDKTSSQGLPLGAPVVAAATTTPVAESAPCPAAPVLCCPQGSSSP